MNPIRIIAASDVVKLITGKLLVFHPNFSDEFSVFKIKFFIIVLFKVCCSGQNIQPLEQTLNKT